jgi:hypothetical protein
VFPTETTGSPAKGFATYGTGDPDIGPGTLPDQLLRSCGDRTHIDPGDQPGHKRDLSYFAGPEYHLYFISFI